MNKIFIYAASLLLLTASCEKDGDLVTVGKGDPVTLMGGPMVLYLDNNLSEALALSLTWNDNHKLSTNYNDVLLPANSIINKVEISSSEDFSNPYVEEIKGGSYFRQYTHGRLNSIVSGLGCEAGKVNNVYVRIAATTGENITPLYSTPLLLEVTPYKIDFQHAIVLNSDESEKGDILVSPNEDGTYRGFMSLGAWGNWYLQEGDGKKWGNLGKDGYAFYASSDADKWNFWGSSHNGCRYVTVYTKASVTEWTDHAIPSVTIAGDVQGEMTFNKEKKQWSYSYDVKSLDAVNVTFTSTDATLYNKETGTEAGTLMPMTFAQGEMSIDGSAAKTVTLTPAATGTSTIYLDLSDNDLGPQISIQAGGEAPQEPVNPVLCIMGNDDKWDHTEWLRLTDEDNRTYHGVVYMNSSWGYYFTKTTDGDDWSEISMGDEGKLVLSGGTKITGPGQGLYVVGASLGWMSYWYEMDGAPVTSVACTGFNDDWSMTPMTADPSDPSIYSAEVTATANTPWGVQILLNDSWTAFMGTNADGTITWNKKENAAPAGWTIGEKYKFIVNFKQGTYSLEKI